MITIGYEVAYNCYNFEVRPSIPEALVYFFPGGEFYTVWDQQGDVRQYRTVTYVGAVTPICRWRLKYRHNTTIRWGDRRYPSIYTAPRGFNCQ